MSNYIENAKKYLEVSNEKNRLEELLSGTLLSYEGIDCWADYINEDGKFVLSAVHADDRFSNYQQVMFVSLEELIEEAHEL